MERGGYKKKELLVLKIVKKRRGFADGKRLMVSTPATASLGKAVRVASTAAAGAVYRRSGLWEYQVDTARNGPGRLVGHANRQGLWLATGQRPLAGPGIRE